MLSKEEYLVGIYKIFGVALTTPLGKIFLTIPDIKFKDVSSGFLIYFIMSLVLFLIGVILLLSSYDMIYMKRVK